MALKLKVKWAKEKREGRPLSFLFCRYPTMGVPPKEWVSINRSCRTNSSPVALSFTTTVTVSLIAGK